MYIIGIGIFVIVNHSNNRKIKMKEYLIILCVIITYSIPILLLLPLVISLFKKESKMNRETIKKFLQNIPPKHIDELVEMIYFVSQTFPLSHPLQAAILEAGKTPQQKVDDVINELEKLGQIKKPS